MTKKRKKNVPEDLGMAPDHPNQESLFERYEDEVPLELCKLPSGGKLYPPDHPFYMKDEVEFKAMTMHQENILASPALMKLGTVLDVLLESCIVDEGVDVGTLLMGDRAALLTSIRISGFGLEYRAKVLCKSCNKSTRAELSLANAEIKRLGAEPVSPGMNLFEYETPFSKKKIKFRLLTDADDLNIMKAQEAKKKFGGAGLINTTLSDRLLYQIEEINGITDKSIIRRIIKTMRPMDTRPLRKYMADIEPDLKINEEVVCSHCGDTSNRIIPIGYEFFWPELADELS